MSYTNLYDVIVPEVFEPYVVKKTMEQSALVQSGIITVGKAFDDLASAGGTVVNMPFFEDLLGESEQVIEGADLSAGKIVSGNDAAPIIRRAKMWGATDLSAALSGADPMAAIGDLVAGFWARDMQKELIAILDGAFSGSEMSGNVLDITKTAGSKSWTTEAFIDAQQLLGDASEQLTAVVMHSDTKALLKKQNLLDVIRPSVNADFDTYQGIRVIVDDSCPKTEDGKYTTYLFGEGAVAFGNGSPVGFVAAEVDRDRKKGSGVDYLINRKNFILHPRGIKFTGESVALLEGPSRTELADGYNWIRVYEPKQVRIVQFVHEI
ncbi:MAG: phage major capsid protein [Defluviitaleaceae bacterium]|nr:phage major capsid protein [Defluviitaleaceae bacterium]